MSAMEMIFFLQNRSGRAPCSVCVDTYASDICIVQIARAWPTNIYVHGVAGYTLNNMDDKAECTGHVLRMFSQMSNL